jgi:hypothetical protein
MSASHEVIHCSFCNKDQNDVEKIIAGPNVCICDECVDVCVGIIRGDDHPLTEGFSVATPHIASSDRVTCAICGKVAPAGDALALPGHGFLCRRCTEAVEASLELRREV